MYRSWTIVTLIAVVPIVLLALAVGDAQAEHFWRGLGDGETWNDPDNWNPVGVPDAGSDVVFDITSNTLMDIPSQWFNNNPRDIATYTMDASGLLRMSGYDGQQNSTMLNVFGDVIANVPYGIGIGPLDAFVVGNPLPARWIQDPPIPPVLTSKVVGVDFDMIGDSANLSILAVTNFIGPGTLTAENAAILVGFEANPFDLLGRVPIDYTQGHISNNGAPPGNEPAWTLNGGVAPQCPGRIPVSRRAA